MFLNVWFCRTVRILSARAKMMESAIVSLANKFLSTYIKGLDPTDLSLSILKGEVILRNVVCTHSYKSHGIEREYCLLGFSESPSIY